MSWVDLVPSETAQLDLHGDRSNLFFLKFEKYIDKFFLQDQNSHGPPVLMNYYYYYCYYLICNSFFTLYIPPPCPHPDHNGSSEGSNIDISLYENLTETAQQKQWQGFLFSLYVSHYLIPTGSLGPVLPM